VAHVVYFEIMQASPQASLQSSCDKKDPTTRTDQSRISVLQRSVGPGYRLMFRGCSAPLGAVSLGMDSTPPTNFNISEKVTKQGTTSGGTMELDCAEADPIV